MDEFIKHGEDVFYVIRDYTDEDFPRDIDGKIIAT